MSMTDPIADMLTRIRNACLARHRRVRIPGSRIKGQIARVLEAEGYIQSFETVEAEPQSLLDIELKYLADDTPVIRGLQRVSSPGRRAYATIDEMPKVLGGLGIAIVSTSKGVLTDRECLEQHVGGEVLCHVW